MKETALAPFNLAHPVHSLEFFACPAVYSWPFNGVLLYAIIKENGVKSKNRINKIKIKLNIN